MEVSPQISSVDGALCVQTDTTIVFTAKEGNANILGKTMPTYNANTQRIISDFLMKIFWLKHLARIFGIVDSLLLLALGLSVI